MEDLNSVSTKHMKNYKSCALRTRKQSKWNRKEAELGYKFIPYRYRVPIATAAQLYVFTANKIYDNPLIVYSKKVKPTKLRVILTLIKVSMSCLW